MKRFGFRIVIGIDVGESYRASRMELDGCATVWGKSGCCLDVDSEEVDFMVAAS
jgi:hypothetical protein